MRAIVTCGPASEPIDAVRVISNRSTGELGARLAEALMLRKFSVQVFRGKGAEVRLPEGVEQSEFEQNEQLWSLIDSVATAPDFIFHAAALCDFSGGTTGKLTSRGGDVMLKLSPLPKLLPRFRERFPAAKIVGWKFEVEGLADDARAAAVRQLQECDTDLCVLNGPALGRDFGFEVFSRSGFLQAVRTKREISEFLADWAAGV